MTQVGEKLKGGNDTGRGKTQGEMTQVGKKLKREMTQVGENSKGK